MNSRSYYFLNLVQQLASQCKNGLPGHGGHSDEAIDNTIAAAEHLAASMSDGKDSAAQGQARLGQIIAHFPDIATIMHRDLLWCFGGDCLHFLGDDELARYQQLEERYYEDCRAEDAAESGLYRDLRAKVFGMH